MKKRHVLIPLGAGALACAAIALSFRASESPEDVTALASPTSGAPAGTSQTVVAVTQPASTPPAPAPIELDPNVNYLAVGQAEFARRDWPASIEALQRACVQEPDSFKSHYLLGLALRYAGRNEESNVAFEHALEISPHDVRAQINSARTLLELQRAEEAESRVRAAAETEPANAEAWNVLGRALLMRGQSADAEAALQKACELDSKQAYARNNLGLVRLQRGAWADALTVLEEAVQLRGDVAYFHNNLGLAYERLGRSEDAAHEYARALELRPEYAKARASLARLTSREQALAKAPGDSTASAATDSVEQTSNERGNSEVTVKP